MINSVVKKSKKAPIVTKVDLPATFMAIPKGTCAEYDCRTIGHYATVYSAVRRLNEKIGGKEPAFKFDTPDNGATYLITNLRYDQTMP